MKSPLRPRAERAEGAGRRMQEPGKGLLIDSHAHLDAPEFDRDRAEVIRRAWEAGLKALVTIGTGGDFSTCRNTVETAGSHAGIYATVGIHPHDAATVRPKTFEKLRELARHPKVVAIGETGLDYHYMHSPVSEQRKVFMRSLELAKGLDMPVVIHTREAEKDTLAILKETFASGGGSFAGGVVHCFSGDYGFAAQLLDLGLYLSFTGLVTFPKAEGVWEVIRKIPLDRILLETDSPYLAPVPFRGRRNEPAHVVHVARKVGEILGKSYEEVAWATGRNAIGLFRLSGLRASDG